MDADPTDPHRAGLDNCGSDLTDLYYPAAGWGRAGSLEPSNIDQGVGWHMGRKPCRNYDALARSAGS
jgi:hypothetical protein